MKQNLTELLFYNTHPCQNLPPTLPIMQPDDNSGGVSCSRDEEKLQKSARLTSISFFRLRVIVSRSSDYTQLVTRVSKC